MVVVLMIVMAVGTVTAVSGLTPFLPLSVRERLVSEGGFAQLCSPFRSEKPLYQVRLALCSVRFC
jgi:hypothetical protein